MLSYGKGEASSELRQMQEAKLHGNKGQSMLGWDVGPCKVKGTEN